MTWCDEDICFDMKAGGGGGGLVDPTRKAAGGGGGLVDPTRPGKSGLDRFT